jgi:hypothetical protein
VRNVYDAAVSYFRFLQGWWLEYDDSFFEYFTDQNLLHTSRSSFVKYYGHLASWLPLIDKPNVLFVAYEQMLVCKLVARCFVHVALIAPSTSQCIV